jgi:hypothetical protein
LKTIILPAKLLTSWLFFYAFEPALPKTCGLREREFSSEPKNLRQSPAEQKAAAFKSLQNVAAAHMGQESCHFQLWHAPCIVTAITPRSRVSEFAGDVKQCEYPDRLFCLG